MEKYKKSVVARMVLLSILALFAAGLGVYDVFWATAEIKAGEIFAFQCGITTALGILALVQIMRYRKALRSDKALQMQYIKENDERMKAIRAKAGMPMTLIFAIMLVLAGVTIGYINMTVFYTLIAAAVIQLVIVCIVKLAYTKIL